MNYNQKKNELLKKIREVLNEEKNIYLKILKLSKELEDLTTHITNLNEKLDFLNLMEDLDIIKFTSLTVSLLYVENPTDKEILRTLIEDMDINQKDNFDGKKK